MAHTRLNDRVDADGRPGTFIEELQSDRHQEGRKKGYIGETSTDGWTAKDAGNGIWMVYSKEGEQQGYYPGSSEKDAIKEAAASSARLDKAIDGKIPDAPFKKDWPVQLTKRVIRDAVADGKDWVGWTNGETQNDRYDISKQIGMASLAQARGESGKYTLYLEGKNGDRMFVNRNGFGDQGQKTVTPKEIEDTIGKDVATRLIEGADAKKDGDFFDIKGDGLKIQGKGMRGFYDEILPKEIGKYIAKFGGKVEKVTIPTDIPDRGDQLPTQAEVDNSGGKEIWKFDITPQMRESVSSKGQPLFKPNDGSNDLANGPQKVQDSGSERVQNKLFKSGRSERPFGDQSGETGQFLGAITSQFKEGDGSSEDAQGLISETSRLVKLAKQNGILLDKFPKFLKRDDEEKDFGGAEHHVFRVGDRIVKVTRGNTPVGHDASPTFRGWKMDRGESPLGYLQRMELTNQVFDDDIRLHAVVKDKHGNVSTITSQPFYGGDRIATHVEAKKAMEDMGFKYIGNSGYYRASDNVAALDLHDKNAIMDGDKFIPFDALVIHPSEDLKERLLEP